MKCPKCGFETNEFICPNCGNNLSEANVNEQVSNTLNQSVVENVQEQNVLGNVQPVNNMETVSQPVQPVEQNNKVNKKSKLPIILVVVVLLAAAVGVYFFTKGNKASSKTNNSKVEVSKAFFLKNGDYSALFNTDGKQLSEFIYKNGENTIFHDGVAYARTETENMIIDENGKVLRSGKNNDFSLSDVGFFYKVEAGDKVAIINYNQKTIVEFAKDSKYKYEYEGNYFLAEYENSYALYNKDGKELLKGERTTTFDDRSRIQFGLYNKFGYLILFAEGKNYLYDSNEKLVTTFDSEYRYCIDELANGDLYFTHCLRDTNERNERKVYSLKNKKVYDIPNEWYKLEANGKQVLANVNPGTYFLKDNYELGREYKGKNYEEFMNEDTYVLNTSGKVEFYKNGKLVNTVENLNINLGYGAVSYVTDFYILYNKNDKLYYAYDKDGKQLFGKGFASIDDSKKDGYYRIKDGSKYYIMDSKGKKLTGEYDSIYRYETDNGVYYEVKASNVVALLDKNEKKLYECSKCKDIYVDTFLGKDYAEVSEGINKTTAIVDLRTKKEIVKTTGDLWAREQYIEETDGNTKRYYTYTGKKFFEK